MRKAGKFYNPPVPQLGVMMESGKVRVDTMTLKKRRLSNRLQFALGPEQKNIPAYFKT